MFSGLWDGSLKPELTVSRAQFAMLLTKALPLPTKRSSQGFQDVPANHWAAAAIAQADRMGFLSGFPDQTFRPEELLTRLDALVSLVNGLGLTGDNPSVLGVYRDRAQIPSFAIGAIAAATQHRLVMSYPWVDRLNPWARLTWAEVAVMLYQALVVTEQAIALPCPYIVNPQPNATFADIQGHWAAEFIRGLASQGLMDGLTEGQFEPDRPMMRSEYAELLVKGFNPAADRPAKFFADIPPDSEWADAIQQVYQGKLMGGFADNTFHPNRGITRVQVLLSLVNAIKFPAADLAILDRYQDAETIPASVRNVVATATTEWLVVNYPNLRELHPNQPATRAEIAAMVYQALVRLGRASAISSPYIIHPQQPNQKQPRDPNAALVVAIDPGHGGFDLGGIGLDGVREKDVTLPMAIDVADWLKRQNIQPILTRSGDYDLELATRVEIAENADADLFISLHANVNPNQPTLNGLELYHYAASTESARLAQAIHHSLVRSIEVRDRGIHHANFYTLRLPPMPSVLVEIGYLTGQQDAANLANATYRNYLAQAIAIGILRYVQQMRE
ncbi:MAG: hypothetical protein HC769_24845 [Cyanobacteria bacterium CRU_2_1]|nr:hypothetical protein [Cyanobacteria bacterium CRU_2_1]